MHIFIQKHDWALQLLRMLFKGALYTICPVILSPAVQKNGKNKAFLFHVQCLQVRYGTKCKISGKRKTLACDLERSSFLPDTLTSDTYHLKPRVILKASQFFFFFYTSVLPLYMYCFFAFTYNLFKLHSHIYGISSDAALHQEAPSQPNVQTFCQENVNSSRTRVC